MNVHACRDEAVLSSEKACLVSEYRQRMDQAAQNKAAQNRAGGVAQLWQHQPLLEEQSQQQEPGKFHETQEPYTLHMQWWENRGGGVGEGNRCREPSACHLHCSNFLI